MTVRVREWKRWNKVGFEVDIRFTYPDGTRYRGRVKAPVESKSAAKRWGEAKERALLIRPSPVFLEQQEERKKEVPKLADFGPRFIENYAKANRHKPSGIHTKESVLRIHLYPALGDKKLDAIDDEDVQHLKAKLSARSPKTVNNVLTVLGKLLKVAVKWKVIDAMPCAVELLKVSSNTAQFYEPHEYRRLVEAARKIDARIEVMVLLGGDAGLRRGEMMALRWCDTDLRRGQLLVEQSEWNGIVGKPKGGRGRVVPMTRALASALSAHRHLRSERVLSLDDGSSVPGHLLRDWHERALRRAGLPGKGGLHILRHTFCSLLAMRGAPAKAIQELAGHQNLTTTLRYMHLSPVAREGAIRLLDDLEVADDFGEIVERSSESQLSS
jgi:integrase